MIITIKPSPGIVLHNPGNFMRPISEEGTQVEDNAYWRRRIADGNAILVPVPDPVTAAVQSQPIPAIQPVAATQPIPATDTVPPRGA